MSALLDRQRAENGPKPRVGRPMAPQRAEYMRKFGVTRKVLVSVKLRYLDACADDSARRLLLGIGERFEVPQTFAPVGMSPAVAERVRRAA